MADDVLQQRGTRVLRTVHFKRDVLSVDTTIDEHVGQNNLANTGTLHSCKPIGVFTDPQRAIEGPDLFKHAATRQERLTHVTGSRPRKRMTFETSPLMSQ